MSSPVTVGYRGGANNDNPSEMWFSPQFLAAGVNEAPVCSYRIDGSYVHRTFRQDSKWPGLHQVWQLTGTYDEDGFRLGVWPD